MINRNLKWPLALLTATLLGAFGAVGCDRGGVGDAGVEPGVVAEEEGIGQEDMEGLGEWGDEGVLGGESLFGRWDGNDDAYITEQEFDTGVNSYGYYDSWDNDSSGFVDEQEFQGGFFTAWDTNGDSMLDNNEIDRGVNDWFDNEQVADPVVYDTNQDNLLDRQEFDSYFFPHYSDAYSEWDEDSDGRISTRDFDQNLFEAWDVDNDRRIDETEFKAG